MPSLSVLKIRGLRWHRRKYFKAHYLLCLLKKAGLCGCPACSLPQSTLSPQFPGPLTEVWRADSTLASSSPSRPEGGVEGRWGHV